MTTLRGVTSAEESRTSANCFPPRPRCLPRLKNDFDGELYFSCRRAGSGQCASDAGGVPVTKEDVRVVGRHRRRKISMVQEVKNLRAELHVEILGDLADVIIFEHREVHFRSARAGQDVAAGVATQIEAAQITWKDRCPLWCRICRCAWYKGIAVGIEKCLTGSNGAAKPLGFNVVLNVAGIDRRIASGPAQAIGKIPIIGTKRAKRITSGTKGGAKWHTAASRKDDPLLPPFAQKPCGARSRLPRG